ncbi:MAG: FAD:protein FMN transferase [Acetivibrio sp.]
MMKKRSKWAILGMIVCFLAGCQKSSGVERFDAQFLNLFDTMTEIIGYAENKESFSKEVEKIHDKLYEYHLLYDIYNDYDGIHNIKTINDNAGIKPVKVDKKIIDLLLFGKEMFEKTKGKMNIAYGSVLTIWHEYRTKGLAEPKKAALPEKEELEEAANHADIDKMIIDEEASTVFLEDEKMSLDVGALGKGYAVEMVSNYAKEEGMHHLLISVGGNIAAIGTRGDGTKWKLGIQNPDKESEQAYVCKVKMENQSLVTSGSYQRYYVVNGKEYPHIIDPDTGMPSQYFAGVSILSEHSGIADALSTAVYNMPFKEGKALIEGLENTEAMWIYKDGRMDFTGGFKEYIAE